MGVVVDAAHTLCASCAQLKVGGTQEKRDKGYVLEQLSAAKKEGDCSLFFLQFLYSIVLFLFFFELYYTYIAQQKKRKKKVFFFSNNRKDCITQAHKNPIYHITLSIFFVDIHTLLYKGLYWWGSASAPHFLFLNSCRLSRPKRHVVLSSHTKSVFVSPFLQLEFVLRRVERELKNCLKTFWEAYTRTTTRLGDVFFF